MAICGMAEVKEDLISQGWHLKDSALLELQPSSKSQNFSSAKAVSLALNRDLSEIGRKFLQEKLLSIKEGRFLGPCVLQIVKVRNISAPKANELSNFAPRMLKIVLTDGSSTVNAIEYEKIEQLSLKTPPGTKVKLIGTISFSSGVLHLQSGCVKVLGGEVEKLYTKWKINCDTVGLSRVGISTDGGPPPFVAFGKRIAAFSQHKKDVKSLKSASDDNENSEFNEQRKAAIAGVVKETGENRPFVSDARAKFGKIPEAGVSQKVSSSFNHHQTESAKSSNRSEPVPQKSAGIYRELSTDSGENVHQKTVHEFVSMGFKHDDVVFCLRKANNDFDKAMDMLVEMSSSNSAAQGANDRRGWSSDERRGQRTPRGGRGGRRGRGRSQAAIEEPQSQGSNQATLFDFLESKISNVSITEKNEDSERSSGHKTNEDDRGHGKNPGSDRHYSDRGGRGHLHRGRGGIGRNGHYGDENQREIKQGTRNWQGNKGYTQRARDFNDKRDQNYADTKGNNQNRRQGKQSFGTRGVDGQQNQNYSKDTRRQNSENRSNAKQTEGVKTSQQQQDNRNRGSARPMQGNRGNLHNSTDNTSRGSRNRPPRFSKHNVNEVTTEIKQEFDMDEQQENRQPDRKNEAKSDLQALDHFPINPPPAQRGPTTFGSTPSQANHDVRQEIVQPPANNMTRNQFGSQQVHVVLTPWQPGMECMAKYWEDGQYYEAIITDLHPTVPTAVVQFLGFGNYEEVRIIDLKPIVAPPFQDSDSHGVNFQHAALRQQQPPYMIEHNQRTAHRCGRPPMALYVPPQSRG